MDTTVVRLGDLLATSPITGTRQSDDGEADQIPFVTTSLVSSGVGAIVSVPHDRTSRAVKGRLAAFDDILLSSRGVERQATVPTAIVKVPERLAFAESLLLVRVDREKADPDFVRLYLASETGAMALRAVATGTSITYLRPESLMGITLHLPPIDVQRMASAKVAALIAALSSLETTVETYRALVRAATEGLVAGSLRPRTRQSPERERAGDQ